MTLYSMVDFTMLVKDCGAQLLAVLVLHQSDLLLGGLPTMAMSPTCPPSPPCYLPIAGTVVGKAPGRVHTPVGLRTSPMGPTAAPRSPAVWFCVRKDTYPGGATRRHCRSLGGGEAVYRQEETYALGSSFHPQQGGLAGGNS